MPHAIAVIAPKTLGFSGDLFHDPFHAPCPDGSVGASAACAVTTARADRLSSGMSILDRRGGERTPAVSTVIEAMIWRRQSSNHRR
jgi:hypothetical protein